MNSFIDYYIIWAFLICSKSGPTGCMLQNYKKNKISLLSQNNANKISLNLIIFVLLCHEINRKQIIIIHYWHLCRDDDQCPNYKRCHAAERSSQREMGLCK